MNLQNKKPRALDPHHGELNIDFKIRGKMGGIVFPCFADVKYDGKSVTLIKNSDTHVIMTTERYTRTISTPDKPMLNNNVENGIYLAEWVHDVGKWESLFKATDKNDVECRLIIFDVLAVNGTDVSMKSLLTRKEIVTEAVHIRDCRPITKICQSREELDAWFKEVVDDGYEGLVVKNMHESFIGQKWVKMKPPERMTHGTTASSE